MTTIILMFRTNGMPLIAPIRDMMQWWLLGNGEGTMMMVAWQRATEELKRFQGPSGN